MKRVLIAFPSRWDARQLELCRRRWDGRYEIAWGDPTDADCSADLDPVAWVDQAARRWGGSIDGVFSASDYPGAILSAALAERLDLPGPGVAAVLTWADKVAARRALAEAVPEATVDCWEIDSSRPDAPPPDGLPFPCFVKPVKGAFSVLARRIDSPRALAEFLARPEVSEHVDGFLRIFRRALVAWGGDGFVAGSADGCRGWLLAEELLTGCQVTVEGWCFDGEVGILGVVDSVLDAATGSFVRFDFPSSLPAEVQTRMAALAERTMRCHPLDRSLFNIEILWNAESDRLSIVEVNPRMCGQFADLYDRVDGRHGYEVALSLAVGEPPPGRRGGSGGVAASLPLRVFEPVRVVAAPDAATIAAAETLVPGSVIWNECVAGEELTDLITAEDGASVRYGVVNLGAPDREVLLDRGRRLVAALGYRFESASPRPADVLSPGGAPKRGAGRAATGAWRKQSRV